MMVQAWRKVDFGTGSNKTTLEKGIVLCFPVCEPDD